jgi:hypothetical protein
MKVCILGNTNLGYSWFVRTYKQGLQLNGHSVMEIDYKATPLLDIKAKLLYEKPKLVFCHLTFHNIYPVSMVLDVFRYVNKQVGTKFIHTCNDARTVDRYMGDVSGAYHAAFVGTYDLVRNCSAAWGIPVHYTPYSCMTYENFLKVILTQKKMEEKVSKAYKMKIDLMDFVDDYQTIVATLLKEIYGEEGYEWYSWFCWDNNYGTKDWSKTRKLIKLSKRKSNT